MKNREKRHILVVPELRTSDDGKVIFGLAVPWNSLSVDLGGFREQFAPGAFGDLSDLDVVATFNHNYELIVGRTPSTLTLSEDGEGLRYEITPPDTTAARDLLANLASDLVRGSSFTFSILPDGDKWREDDDGTMIRTVTAAKLYEVAPVVNPAYPESTAGRRSLEKWREEQGRPSTATVREELARARAAFEASL